MIKEKLKLLCKTEKSKALLITSIIAVLYLIWLHSPGFVRNISDFCFMVGILHVVVGATRYIHNVGLFKTFKWMAYRRRTRKTKALDGTELRPMSLADYTHTYIYADQYQKAVDWPLIRGVLFLAVSFAISFFA